MFCTPKHFLCRLLDILPKLTDWFYDRSTSVKGVNKYHHEPWKMSKLDDLLGEGRHEELTLFFPMFPFDLSENIRKPLVFFGFLMFSGGSKGNIGKKRVTKYCFHLHFYCTFHDNKLIKIRKYTSWVHNACHLAFHEPLISVDGRMSYRPEWNASPVL